jgi:preprotein translocase subunit SecD
LRSPPAALLFVALSVIGAALPVDRLGAQQARPVAATSPLRFHWLVEGTASGQIIRRGSVMGDSATLEANPVLTLADIDSIITRHQLNDSVVVGGVIRRDARPSLERSTGANVGRLIAVVWDEQVVTVARIESALSSVLPIATLPKPQADQLATQLRTAHALIPR